LFWILPVSAAYIVLKTFDTHQQASRLALALFLAANASVIFFLIQSPQVFTKISLSGYKPIKTPELIEMKTTSGLSVWVPEGGLRCWDSPLPCTQELDPELQLIGKDIQSGFMIAPE
jgi:hypothetical protein